MTLEDLDAATFSDANVGRVMFLLFGLWFTLWFTYVGLMWAVRLLAGMKFRERW